jgi:hypothetical protein
VLTGATDGPLAIRLRPFQVATLRLAR